MQITVNGQSREVPQGATVAELLTELQLAKRPVAIEGNRLLIPREQHRQHALKEGDVVEIVALVGGG